MMNSNMKKVMSYIGAIGAAVTCLVMVFFEVINMHAPALVWFAFSVFMLSYVIAKHGQRKAKMN